ncbi:unnamed protein product, partial [Didymodactylos carnosus]
YVYNNENTSSDPKPSKFYEDADVLFSCKDIVNTPYAIDRDNDKQDTLTDYGEPANEATMPTTNDGSLTREVSVTSTSDGTPPSSKSTFKRENGDGGWGV